MKNDLWLIVQLFLPSTPPHSSFSPNPSYFLHISPSLSVCVRQLSGLLPVKLHERTGGSTFLLNIALHSGDSLPCLSLPLPALCFCPFLHCNVQLEPWATPLSEPLFSLFASFLCLLITERMLVFVQKFIEPCVILNCHGISQVFTHSFSHGGTTTLHSHCQLDFFCKEHLACRQELAWIFLK